MTSETTEPEPTPKTVLTRAFRAEGMVPLVRAAVVVWLTIGIATLALFGLWLLYQIRDIFPPLVLALALIFLLNPVVAWMERRGVRRGLGTMMIYIAFLTLVFLVGLGISRPLGVQIEEFSNRLPELVDEGTALAERLAKSAGVSFDEESLRSGAERLQSELFTGFDQITRFATGALHLVFIFILAPILALYLLIDLPRLQRSFVGNLPPRYRGEWLELLRKCGDAVGGFFRGQLVVAAIVALLSSVALLLAGIPFWLPIGLLAGFFNLVPMIGPFIGGGVAVLVGAASGGPIKALLAGAAMLIVQQIDNHLISPRVLGRTLRLHPVTIMMALLAGGTVAGLWGMLLAVPSTAVAKILVMHYYSTHILVPEGLEPSDSLEIETSIEEVIEIPADGGDRDVEDGSDASDEDLADQTTPVAVEASTLPANNARRRPKARPAVTTGKRGRAGKRR